LGVAGGRALEGARGLKKRLAAACTWQTGRSGFAPLKKLRINTQDLIVFIPVASVSSLQISQLLLCKHHLDSRTDYFAPPIDLMLDGSIIHYLITMPWPLIEYINRMAFLSQISASQACRVTKCLLRDSSSPTTLPVSRS
ncbi:putative proline-specific permease put4, partial [Fusarium oxysporum f. sp. albedinis]